MEKEIRMERLSWIIVYLPTDVYKSITNIQISTKRTLFSEYFAPTETSNETVVQTSLQHYYPEEYLDHFSQEEMNKKLSLRMSRTAKRLRCFWTQAVNMTGDQLMGTFINLITSTQHSTSFQAKRKKKSQCKHFNTLFGTELSEKLFSTVSRNESKDYFRDFALK